MTVKLDTINISDNKVSKKQYAFNKLEDINLGLLHQVVKGSRTNFRNNTASVKTRAQVSGTGAKPWSQKGTGRARQGSLRSPQFAGGGVAHGPGTRVYQDRTPKKMKKKALDMAISQRIEESSVFVVNGSDFSTPSTKQAVSSLNELNIERNFTFIYSDNDEIPELKNIKDLILKSKILIFNQKLVNSRSPCRLI